MKTAFLKSMLLVSTLPLLGGCVAAVVPLAASGVLLGKGDKKDKKDDQFEADVTPLPAPTPKPVVIVGPVETDEPVKVKHGPSSAALPAPMSETSPAELPAAAEESNPAGIDEIDPTDMAGVQGELPPRDDFTEAFAGAVANDQAENAAVAEPLVDDDFTVRQPQPATALPSAAPLVSPPVAHPTQTATPRAVPSQTSNPAQFDFRAYDVFYSYVEQQARRDPVGDERQSALLASPGNLSPRRTDCSIRPPAVLIDLDPVGGVVSLAGAQRPDPALAQILLSLRMQEIDIFWVSERPALDAAALRRVLVQSGLDPLGRDGLLLMRREDDRKQTRRKELGETHCLLAIAGDERADFDELYLYLKDTGAAQPLEELIGAGWFLAPLPLTEG